MGSRLRTQHRNTRVLLLGITILYCCCRTGTSAGCIEADRQALIKFKNSVIDNDNRLSLWVDEDCCKWAGISCHNETGHVEGFDVTSFSLQGKFPDFLITMTSLKQIILVDNSFQGPLPSFLDSMTSLEVLDLSLNVFNGTIQYDLSQLCNLTKLDLSFNNLTGGIDNLFQDSSSGCFKTNRLEFLRLSSNQLSGHLPNWLGQLKNLKYLYLDHNTFHGPIPASLFTLSSLIDLYLNENQLNGTIPESLGELSQLEELYLSYNSFEGVISEVHFATLSDLKYLDLSSNSLTLELGSGWVPPFQIQEIDLSSCKMGPQFPSWLQTQKELVYMQMPDTGIIDLVPEWFFSMYRQEIRRIDLSFNQLHGELPKMLSRISALALNNNNLEGHFPNFSSYVIDIDLSHNVFSGPVPQNIGVMYPNLNGLVLSNNSFSGSIPHSLCKLKELVQLDLSLNHFVGGIPQCIGDELQNITTLDLSYNNLSGIIPNSIGNLINLKSLHLSRTNVYGQIPSSLKNCTALFILDLGENNLFGNIPTWIGETLPSLRVLRLRQNQFSGVIPLQICLLARLQLLDLAQNDLSGTIPLCFGNFSYMISDHTLEDWFGVGSPDKTRITVKGRELEYTKTVSLVFSMDLSSNKLVGEIPTELMTLFALNSMNLSKNQLVGSIPDTIGKMVSLESLDLSHNMLSGKIPESMSALTFLGHLNLSHNNLSGRIPSGNQLQTLDDPSIYIDNHDLCGAPLEIKCSEDTPPELPPPTGNGSQENKKDESGITSFYIGFASGHVVGFWGVCSVLFFNRTWRIAFFQFLSGAKDWLLVKIAVNVNLLKKKLNIDKA